MKKLFKSTNKCSSGGGAELTKNPINKGDNKRKVITISLVVVLIMLCVGISFAVWNYSFLGSSNTLETGEVSLELLESNTNLINLTNQLPMSDNEGKTLETFDFAVITKASRDMNLGYEIKIEKLSTDTGYTSLNDNEVKVYLTDYDNNQLVSPVKISDLSNYSLYSKVNTHSKTITEIKDKYKLRVWIDSEVDASKFYDENTDSVKTYQYKFKIGVNGGENYLTGLARIIADNSVLDNTSSTYVTAQTGINFAEAPSDTNGKGIYQRAGTGTNGEYPVYYYRGEVDNNNLAFNNYCWKIVRTTETGGVKLIYNGEYDGDCNNTGSASTIGKSKYNYVNDTTVSSNNATEENSVTTLETQGKEESTSSRQILQEAGSTPSVTLREAGYSPADVGYMYGTRYIEYQASMAGDTNTIIYGNDVTYSDGKYTLKDTITSTSYDNDYQTIGANHHYTCFNSSNSCSEVYYILLTINGNVFSLKLTGGVNIEEALNEMLANSSNENDSTIKTFIDSWYSSNMNSQTSLLEDTIWCNDRTIYNKGVFDKDTNAGVTNATYEEINNTLLLFKLEETIDRFETGKTINLGLKCTTKNDSFTVGTNGNGKLTYPVGLLTGEEVTLAGNGYPGYSGSSYLTTGNYYWLASPNAFAYGLAYVSGVDSDGRLDADAGNAGISNGVRPSISLKPGTNIDGGDGTSSNPYMVGQNVPPAK
ncbi:MAG: hypothetical protein ACI31R_01440 [Bacilli bacterium]